MARLYLVLLLLCVLGGVGYGAYSYYTSTQQRIQTLSENNAKLEVAIEKSEASINLLQSEASKNAQLNNQLQTQLQKAEEYGDNLRKKLRRLDLIGDALKNAANLEGRMNSATAKLWREIMAETGSNDGGKRPLPNWLQSNSGTKTENSDADTKSNSTDSDTTKTN